MRSIEILLEEHRAIERMLGVLDALAERLEGRRAVPPQVMDRALRYLSELADGLHHAKEERVLFPLLERHDIGPDQPFMNALTEHHHMGRSYVRQMYDSWSGTQRGAHGAQTALALEIRSYVELLREHIRIEDEFFGEVSADHLTAVDDRELVAGFEAVDEERRGHGVLDDRDLLEACHRDLRDE